MDGYSILQKVCVAGINILFSNSDKGRQGKRNNCIRGFRISEYRHCRPDNSTLADIIDNHAPQKSRIVTVRADKPWYTAKLSLEKRLRGKYERKWKKNELNRNNPETSLNSSTDQVSDSVSIFCGVSFEQFHVVSEADIRKIISSSPTKSCALDPIPTWLLKQCKDQLPHVLTTIVKKKYLTTLCWISNWTEEGLSYPSYHENNHWLWFF